MSKSIIITGKHNKDKLFNPEKKHKRNNNIFNEIDKKWLDVNNQLQLVNSLFLNLNHPIEKYAFDELKRKLRSYKLQDDKKKIYNEKSFVTCNDVLERLVICKLKCFYCNCRLYFLYENVRQKDQWTLDRIDNDYGHNTDNIVISCLDCNLKRRTKDMNIFKEYRVVNVKKSEC